MGLGGMRKGYYYIEANLSTSLLEAKLLQRVLQTTLLATFPDAVTRETRLVGEGGLIMYV